MKQILVLFIILLAFTQCKKSFTFRSSPETIEFSYTLIGDSVFVADNIVSFTDSTNIDYDFDHVIFSSLWVEIAQIDSGIGANDLHLELSVADSNFTTVGFNAAFDLETDPIKRRNFDLNTGNQSVLQEIMDLNPFLGFRLKGFTEADSLNHEVTISTNVLLRYAE